MWGLLALEGLWGAGFALVIRRVRKVVPEWASERPARNILRAGEEPDPVAAPPAP
jgi:hypothetical protein